MHTCIHIGLLKVHQNVFGDMLVPRYFVIPAEDPWPKECWGLQLGNRVRNIRAKTAYNKPRFHQLLLDEGFMMNIENVRIPFVRAAENFEKVKVDNIYAKRRV
jgi:hypothetical protein